MKHSIKILWLLLCFFLAGTAIVQAQTELYVAVDGDDNNSGSINAPLATLIGARDKIRSIKASSGIPSGGIIVWVRGGRYPLTATCHLGAQDSGEANNPITYSGYPGEQVIFDGSKFVEADSFKIVTDPSSLNKLHFRAQGQVYAQTVTDVDLIDLLKKTTSQMSMNDRMLTISRFPNLGFAHINNASIVPGLETNNTPGTETDPKGAQFKLSESIDGNKWSIELNRIKKAQIRGYVSADWNKETRRIHSVGSNGAIRLMDGSSYGIRNRGSSPNRLFAFHLLCELDEPGEWYFDNLDNKLYLWPSQPIDSTSEIGVWAGPQCFDINGGNHINIKKMTIQGIGKGVNGDGAINIDGNSSHCLVAGVTFRYIAAPVLAFNIWHNARNCGAVSCDFYDIPNATRLYGGAFTANSIEYGNNFIENCHFTQIHSKDFYGKACGMNGAGNKFKNNLIHNMNGQPVTHAGFDHEISLNEVFNVGIEEGDGGAFYTGASVWSYGNVIKHNFVHHIMSVPKLLGRAAFFSDDYDGGEIVTENVVYKGGWEAIKMNKGGGHTITKNVVMECYRGIRQGDGGSAGYNSAINFLINDPLSNSKANYLGRMLKTIGIPGWESGLTADNWNSRVEQFWRDRYPFMNTVFNKYDANDKMNAYECRFYENLFYSNNTDILGGPTVAIRDSRAIGLDLFVDPGVMNFSFKSPRPAYAPNIPFNNIGLYQDEYRCGMPDKNAYRRNIKNRFIDQDSHTNDPYDFNTINDRLYYNTGKMVVNTVPCTRCAHSKDPETPSNAVPGLNYKYYHGSWDKLPNFNKLAVVESGDVATFDISPKNRDDHFAFVFEGFIDIPTDGEYTFYTNSDDGSRLFIGTSLIVNNDGLHSDQERSGTICLKKGKHGIKVTYFERTGGNVLGVNWEGPGISKGTIPANRLFRKSEETEYKFDVGTPTSAVFDGYIGISHITTGKFGWVDTTNLDSRDRGTSGGVNHINRDFVFSSSPATFETEVDYGTWHVLFTFGDRTHAHDDMIVKAEGVTQLTDIDTQPGVFFNRDFVTDVTDGKLSLEFSDGGGADPNWQVTRIWLRKTNPIQASYGGSPLAIPGMIEAEDYDVGKNGVAFHDTSNGNNGGSYRSDDVDVMGTQDAGGYYNVTDIEDGEWLEYTVHVNETGNYYFHFRVNNQEEMGTLHVELDGVDITGPVNIPQTQSWANVALISDVALLEGDHVMQLFFDVGNFDLNLVEIEKVPSNCANAQEWNATTIYDHAGISVRYNGRLFESKYYSLGTTPDTPHGPWELTGNCGASKPDCFDTPRWNPANIYQITGTQVIHDDILYRSKWYVEPGMEPGVDPVWEYVGPCSASSLNADPSACTENVPTWGTQTVYENPGTEVLHKNHLYVNQWYASAGQEPGLTTVWKLIRPCTLPGQQSQQARVAGEKVEKLVEENIGDRGFFFFPNPLNTDQLTVKFLNPEAYKQFMILSLEGKVLFERPLNGEETLLVGKKEILGHSANQLLIIRIIGEQNVINETLLIK